MINKSITNQNVKIIGVSNGVTKVSATSGAQRGTDLFVAGDSIGVVGEIVELPEFRIENFESELATQYAAE